MRSLHTVHYLNTTSHFGAILMGFNRFFKVFHQIPETESQASPNTQLIYEQCSLYLLGIIVYVRDFI